VARQQHEAPSHSHSHSHSPRGKGEDAAVAQQQQEQEVAAGQQQAQLQQVGWDDAWRIGIGRPDWRDYGPLSSWYGSDYALSKGGFSRVGLVL
jgi:hypothetical protein